MATPEEVIEAIEATIDVSNSRKVQHLLASIALTACARVLIVSIHQACSSQVCCIGLTVLQ